MDAPALAAEADLAALQLGRACGELAAAGLRLGRAAALAAWTGRAADAALTVLAEDVVALETCALAADRVARALRVEAEHLRGLHHPWEGDR